MRSPHDPEFWARVFEDHLDDVLNYFMFRVGSRDLAEDLSSTVFERAWTKRHQFECTKGTPRTWLLSIAASVGKNHRRRKQCQAWDPYVDVVDVRGLEPPDILFRSQTVVGIRQAVAGLSEREREIIALKYGGQETNRNIARLTGLGESNVGTIVHRALSKLKTALSQEEADATG